jgi:hypothetical protein
VLLVIVGNECDRTERSPPRAQGDDEERSGPELRQKLTVGDIGDSFQRIHNRHRRELGELRSNDPRGADRIIALRRMGEVKIARDTLLLRLGVNHRDAAYRGVGLDNVDHAPDAEPWQRESRNRRERLTIVERIGKAPTGLGKEGDAYRAVDLRAESGWEG